MACLSRRLTYCFTVTCVSGLGLGGCFEDPIPMSSTTDDPTTGDGDTGDGDGDGDTATGDGDGDSATGDGDGDSATGDGDGDSATGDGDGDTMGDGDGDPGACAAGPYAVNYGDALMLPAGDNSQGSAIGDLDGDGNLDIVASSYDGSALWVHLGNGDGTFEAPTTSTLAAGDRPSLIRGGAIADGVFDVTVRVYTNKQTVGRMRGDGGGGFYDLEKIDLPGATFALGAVTGDAALDVVAPGPMNLSVFPASVGQESYFPPDPIVSAAPWGVGASSILTLGDFDGDSDIDVAGATFANMWMGRNNGAGEFVFGMPLTFFGGPTDIGAGDIDGDGDLDIVLTTAGGGSDGGHLFVGVGDGSFEAEVEISAPSTPNALDMADVDKDGLADLAVVGIGNVAVSLSTGDGFGPAKQKPCMGFNPRQLALGDFNGDCVDDVVTVTDAGVCVLLSTP